MKPSIGRIVHYYTLQDATPRAAIISAVYEDGTVGLWTFPDPALCNGIGSAVAVPYAEAYAPGCWSWPPKV